MGIILDWELAYQTAEISGEVLFGNIKCLNNYVNKGADVKIVLVPGKVTQAGKSFVCNDVSFVNDGTMNMGCLYTSSIAAGYYDPVFHFKENEDMFRNFILVNTNGTTYERGYYLATGAPTTKVPAMNIYDTQWFIKGIYETEINECGNQLNGDYNFE